jgi:hypothetical protein
MSAASSRSACSAPLTSWLLQLVRATARTTLLVVVLLLLLTRLSASLG